MHTSGHLDYLAITFPVGTSLDTFVPLVGQWEQSGTGPNNYQRRFTSELGATLYDHGKVADGVHLILKGQQLEALRGDTSSEMNLIAFCSSLYGRPSRVDLCVNMFEAHVTVVELRNLWETKQYKSRSRKSRRYYALPDEGTDDGFYIGQRGSDKFMRVYDKGRELGSHQAHVRLELECHRLRAQAIYKSIEQAGNVRQVANASILAHCAFFNEEYLLALQDNNVDLIPVPRKEEKFWKWMRTQIAPALVKRQHDYPDERVMDRLESLMDEISKAT